MTPPCVFGKAPTDRLPHRQTARIAFHLLGSMFWALIGCSGALGSNNPAAVQGLDPFWEQHCVDCHEGAKAKGGFDLTQLSRDLKGQAVRERWVRVYDQIERGEMPPKKRDPIPDGDRARILGDLGGLLREVERREVKESGRGPLRRLNRDEYQNSLRAVLKLPGLDIRDMLPEDREGHLFNKSSESLDMSREQLTAYLEAAEAALRTALVTENKPPTVVKYRAVGTDLFPAYSTFGNREAMFFARDGVAMHLTPKMSKEDAQKYAADEGLELALFRSAHWPYFGYPKRFQARVSGDYRVRFSARAVRQMPGFTLVKSDRPQPMTFRARKPSGSDVSGDVRATGGILDIQPEGGVYEATLQLRAGETFEYSLLGLPVPLAFNVDGGPPIYRYPPFPADGQPGVGIQWLEAEGPLRSETWPPESHRVLFDTLPVGEVPADPKAEAVRLFRRFVEQALCEPLAEEDLEKYEALLVSRLEKGERFEQAVLAAYQAVLSSPQFLYLREPERAEDHFAVAGRLSHFLTNTRPDSHLTALARTGRLRERTVLRSESERLIAGEKFDRFIENFAGYWLNLRHIRRDDPDVRLYPNYRFDEYLVESMAMETRAFVAAMFRENLPAKVLVDADFVFANDRLARHYGLEPLMGSTVRRVSVPQGSPYGGLLTSGSVLKVTTNGTTTSPVVRGAWIMERIIGRPPPPPPPSVPAVEPDIRGAKTIRDLLALHTRNESCAGCHAKFDPVGLALENFDICGGWRTRYRGLEQGEAVKGVDRAGHEYTYTLAGTVDANGTLREGIPFSGIRELKAILGAGTRQLGRNLLHQFTVYATGTPVRFCDREEIEAILDACEPEGYRVRDLMLRLIESRIFLGTAGSH